MNNTATQPETASDFLSITDAVVDCSYKDISHESFNTLTDDDLSKFANNFITKEIVKLAEYRRVDDEQGATILNRKRNASTDYSGLLIPYKNPKTGQILEYELRRDKPDIEIKNGREKEVGKYLRPGGSKPLAYFAPGTDPAHFQDTLITIIFTEGVKKVLAILNATTDNLSHPSPFLIVGLSGVDNFRTTQTEVKATGEKRQVKDLLPELKDIDFHRRESLIIFDNNVFTNSNVYRARHRFADTLISLGTIVYFINLPQIDDINGIDDLLGYWNEKHGREGAIKEFNALLKTKRRFLVDAVFSRPLVGDSVTLKIEAGERNKVKVSALDVDGKTVEMHVFNPADADKRASFIKKQLEPVFRLTDTDRQEITRELIRLADLAEIVTKAEKSKDNPNGETIETSFKVLSDGRIIEQIRGGFAIYDPETGEHGIVDTVTDEDGTIYKPLEDDLFNTGGFYIADDLTEYGTTAELDADIEKYLSTYIDLKPLQLKMAAKYARFTFLFDKVLELPYINATGEPGAGKSRFGGAEVMICRRGLYLITPSAASVYRIAEKFHPTMFLDEFNDNNSDDSAAIIQILNAGYQKTGKITRQLGKGDGDFQTALFDPYCPKIIGSLKQAKSSAFNSRCIPIKMEQTMRNDIPLRLTPKMLRDAQQLQNKLTLYRLRHYTDDLEQRLDEAETILKAENLISRTAQVNIPLFAIIEDEDVRAEYINLLKGHDKVLVEQKQQTLDGEIIDKIHTLLFKEDEKGIRWNEQNITTAPVQDEVCEVLTTERLHGMINANRQKEIDIRYFGKLIIGLGLHTKKILRRDSDHYEKKAIIFDYKRLNYLFTIYDLLVTEEFNVSDVSKGNNPTKDTGLDLLTLNGNGIKNENQCQQANLSNQNTYATADIADIKPSENNGHNKKKVYRGLV